MYGVLTRAAPMSTLPKTLFAYLGVDAENAVSLAMGAPGAKTLRRCAHLIQKASNKRLTEEIEGSGYLMQYGPPYGDPQYLEQLAKFLTKEYNDPVDSNSLVATGGASSSLVYLLSLLFPNKCPVFCEEVTYHIGIGTLNESLKFPIVSARMDEDGINVDDLEAQILTVISSDSKSPEPHGLNGVIYLIPVFHNPTGVTLSSDKARQLVLLARRFKLLVICDDVYNILCYDGKPPRRLFAYDEKSNPDYVGNVVSNGSFSKMLTPGLRIGWMELPRWLWNTWNQSPMLLSGGCLNMYMSGIVASALADGSVTQFVNSLRIEYGERMRVAHQVLLNNLPKGCHVKLPQGGYFLWLQFPKSFPVETFQKLAIERYQIYMHAGSKFCPDENSKKKFQNCVRISISYQEKDVLIDALKKVCDIANEVKSQ